MGENNQSILKKGRSDFGLTFFLLLFLVPILNLGGWWSLDMFVDGLTYGSVARNWALGEGSFWNMHYTESLYPIFVEHPPFFFFLEGLLFKVFGDTPWIEELMSSFIWIGFILIFYLSMERPASKTNSLTLAAIGLLLIPNVAWAFQNNMLEPLMTLWFLMVIFFYSRALKEQSAQWASLAAVLSIFAILTKGIVATPILFWPLLKVFDDRVGTRKPIKCYYIVLTLLFIGMILYPPSREFWLAYYQKQIVGSLGQTIGPSVWKRLLDLSSGVLVIVLMGLVFIRLKWLRVSNFQKSEWMFLIMNVLPWLIFSKYHTHYWIPAFVLSWFFLGQHLSVDLKKYKLPILISSLMICMILGLLFNSKNRSSVKLVQAPQLVNEQKVKVSYELCEDWYLHAVFQRAKRIDLSCVNKEEAQLTSANQSPCESGLTIAEYHLCL